MAGNVTSVITSDKKVGSVLTTYILIILQLLGLIFVSYTYELETLLHLTTLLSVTTAGFFINSSINKSYRPYFFGILSLVLLSVVIGWKSMAVVFVLGTLAVLIATFIIPRILKYILLILLFGGLAYLLWAKPDWIQAHVVILATLGTMFMFRLSLFLYDKNYEKERPLFIKDWSYFFMLPNMTMMLFPVVDYKLFLNRYYDDKALSIYKKGVQWVALGVFHLVVYRFIYYYLLLPPSQVNDAMSFWHYAVTNYMLIIRLSGLFHISVGIMCLFGFNLPRVFDNYFLASGFADLWRRINIYFRDYVIRLFYYPLFFKIRKIGDLNAKVLAILVIFIMTWFLHSLQWFWLRGFFPLRMVDAVFWGLFGVLVAGNAIWESKKAKVRPDKKSWRYAAVMTIQIIGMFTFMSILWSVWSSTTMGEWLSVAKFSFTDGSGFYTGMAAGILLLWILGTIIYKQFETRQYGNFIDPDPKSATATFWSVSMVVILLLLQWGPVKSAVEHTFGSNMEGILTQKLNSADENLLVEGYYEEILIGNELTSPISDMVDRGEGGKFRSSEGAILVDDIRIVVGKPNVKFIFKDMPYSSNSLGIRDKEYTKIPAENTIRTAVLGGSYVNGSGVGDDDVFDQILEMKLNEFQSEINYEIINLGNPGFDLIQCIYDFEAKKAEQLNFDNLIYISHGIDMYKNIRTLVNIYTSGIELPYKFLREIIRKSGVSKSMLPSDIFRALEPYGTELVFESYKYLYEYCQAKNIKPIWMFWPTTAKHPYVNDFPEEIAEIVRELNYTRISLDDVYKGIEPRKLFVSPVDRHPNQLGHSLVADTLFKIITENPDILEMKAKN